jgi:carbamoyltransferase
MKVLGVSGYHDSSATLIDDGIIACYLKEERLSRNKRDMFPLKAIELICSNWQPDAVAFLDPYPNENLFHAQLKKYLKNLEPISYMGSHHKCHASTAFYNSGFEKALVFVIDRNGSVHHNCLRESETVFECSYPANIEPLHKNYWVFNTGADSDIHRLNAMQELEKENFSFSADSTMSIVKVYESATTLIGQHPLENGKTMGLSSYGNDKPFKDFFIYDRPIDNLFIHGFFATDSMTTTLLYDHLNNLTKEVTRENYQFYADYAYQVQKQTQDQVCRLVEVWVKKTGIKNVCITGGYGLNVVSNGNLIKNFPDVNFYFEPLADDSGNSIGAAMHLYRELSGDCRINKIQHTFYHGVKRVLTNVGKDCTVFDIAEFIEQGKTVAVFNGLAEAGPRALGNRSILFDARHPNAKEIVNNIKRREWYRPFAGMILEEFFDEYFETHGIKTSENMTVSFQCKKPQSIPGIAHVDNSCRIQTVSGKIPHIYYLLKEFFVRTGCPALLNTSFNMAGKPLIETQEDAIDCFENSELDVLWFPELDKCLVKKEEE